jgi:hypothetical protein
MHWVSAEFVRRLLSDNLPILLQRANDDENLLKDVITSDKMWIYGCDIEAEQQSSHWKNPALPRHKRAHWVRLQVKAVLLVFLFIKALCIMKSLLKVMQDLYLYVLRCLRGAVRRK